MKSSLLTLIFSLTCGLFSACGPDPQNLGLKERLLIEGHTADLKDSKVETCPPSNQDAEKFIIINETGTEDAAVEFVDQSREIKDFGTDFVVNEFFRTEDTLFNFMKLVYTSIDTGIKEYLKTHQLDDQAIFFLFKGGNVLSIIANGVFNLLPPDARHLLKDAYAENFKRSDADFGIFVDEKRLKGKDYEEVMDDMIEMTYGKLNQLREEFTKNPEKYFNFLQLKSLVASKEMNKYFEKLNDLDSLADKDNPAWYSVKFKQIQLLDEVARPGAICTYEGQLDYLFQFDPKNKDNIIATPLTKKSHWIMNSINKALEFATGVMENTLVKFYLVRSKIQFEFTYEKYGKLARRPMGAELIDVSLSHREDSHLRSFLDNYDRFVAKYTLIEKNTGESFTMKAESIKGLINDIYNIIFVEYMRPWEAPKQLKRINRLSFLAITEMLGAYGLGSKHAQKYVQTAKEKIIEPLLKLYPINKNSADKAKQTLVSANNLAENYGALGTSNKILQGLAKLAATQLTKDPAEDDEKEFTNFLKIIENNLNIILKLSEMQPRSIDINKIYQATMSELL